MAMPRPPSATIAHPNRSAQSKAAAPCRRQSPSSTFHPLFRFTFLAAFLAVVLCDPAFAQSTTTIYVNPTSVSALPNGSRNAPFPSLASAWASFAHVSNPNVTLFLAQGTYSLPAAQQLLANGSSSVIHATQTTSSIVKVVPDARSPSDFAPHVLVTDQAVVEFRGIRFTSVPSSGSIMEQPVVGMSTSGSGSLKLVSCTLESASPSSLSIYQLAAAATSTILLDSVALSTANFELNAQENSAITVRGSTLSGTRAAARALFFGSGAAQLSFTSTSMIGVTGSVIDISGTSRVTWDSISLSQVSCGSAQLSVANIRDQAEMYMTSSNVTNVSTAQAQTCVGGLIGLYDQSYLSMQSSLLSNLVGRIVYADGNSLLTISDRSRLVSLTELDIAGQSSAQYLGSMRGNAQVQFNNVVLDSLVGSWIATDSSTWELTATTVVDNVCPPSKSFWLSLAGSASLSMTQSTFKSRDHVAGQSKACTVALMTDETRLSLRQSEIAQYACRSACIDSLGQSLVTMDNTALHNLTSTNRDKPLVSLSSPREHSFTQMRVALNTGPAASVIGVLGLGDQAQTVSITDSHFSSNSIPAVLVGSVASSATISSSNFTRNGMPLSFTATSSLVFPDMAALVNRGSCSVSNCLFTGNSAKYGGAVYHDGLTLSLSDSHFINNRASLDGGALYLASTASMSNLVFQGNQAKRGGGWFTLDHVALLHASSNLIYSSNTPSNYASTFHAIQLGPTSAPLATTGLIATSGATINASIEIRAIDAFGQLYTFGGRDRVLLLQAHMTNSSSSSTEFTDPAVARITGESTQALFRGSVTFRGLQVYGPPFAAYALRFSRVLASGAADASVSVAIPLAIHPCPPGQFEHASTVWGPNFPVCAARACPQGCTRGTCISAGNCSCSPGWEGVACDEPSGAVDSLAWYWTPAAFPVVSVGVRDALASRLHALVANVSDGRLAAQVRQFEREGSGSLGRLLLRFAVLDEETKQAVQAQALADVNDRLLGTLSLPVSWTPGLSTKSPMTHGDGDGNTRSTRSRRSSAGTSTTTSSSTSTVFGFSWPPPGFATARDALQDTQLVSVPKQVMSPAVPTGAALVALHLVSVSIAIALWAFLVLWPTGTHTNVVRASSRMWLTWFTLGVCLVHVWMVVAAMPPTDTVCRLQVGLGAVSVAVVTGAVMFKAAQLWIVCENPILVKSIMVGIGRSSGSGSSSGASSPARNRGSISNSLNIADGGGPSGNSPGQEHGLKQDGTATMLGLSWIGSGLATPISLWFLTNLILISTWLSHAFPLISARVSYLPVDGSYWHCTHYSALTQPAAAWIYYLFHAAMLAFTLAVLVRVRAHGPTSSPSQEPRIVSFVTVNLLAAFSITGAVMLVSGGLGVVTQYLLAAFAMLLALGVSTAGVLGYKVHLVVQAHKHAGLFEYAAAAAAAQGGAAAAGNEYQLAAVKRALQQAAAAATAAGPQASTRPTHLPAAAADDEAILCTLEQSNVLASSLVPVRLLPPPSRLLTTLFTPSPWRVAFVEIAKEYRYMSVAVGNEPARFFGLPCVVDKVDWDCCVLALKFKSGTRMQVQARDVGNLREWVRTMEAANAVVGGGAATPAAGATAMAVSRSRRMSGSVVGTPLPASPSPVLSPAGTGYQSPASSPESVESAAFLPPLPASRSGRSTSGRGGTAGLASGGSSQRASRTPSVVSYL